MLIRILPFLLIFGLFGCGDAKIVSVATGGQIAETSFHQKIDCIYNQEHLFIDVEINGETYLFLFDSGYEVTMIDKDLLDDLAFHPVKKQKTSGSSFDDLRIVYGFLDKLSIDGFPFNNIGVGIQDLSFVSSPFEDKKVYGIVGANILRKAFWQIDYQQKSISFSDELNNVLPDLELNTIILDMIPRNASGWGLSIVDVTINGMKVPFVFDTGSSGGFTGTPALLTKLTGEGIINDSTEFPLKVNELLLGKTHVKDASLHFDRVKQNLIGNAFLDRFTLTMDWQENKLYLSSSEK